MLSTEKIRWCLWAPLVLLALVCHVPIKAQGQGKYLSQLFTLPSHTIPFFSLSLPSKPTLLLCCAPPPMTFRSFTTSHLGHPVFFPFITRLSFLPWNVPTFLCLMRRLSPIRLHGANDHITSTSSHHFTVPERQHLQLLFQRCHTSEGF